jgi:enoyl-CoA hydratase/carnithine racemase
MMGVVELDRVDAGVALIILNRSEVLNAESWQMVDELTACSTRLLGIPPGGWW